MTLKPSEIRFWQQAYLTALGCYGVTSVQAMRCADVAIDNLRVRLEEPGPRPGEGRL